MSATETNEMIEGLMFAHCVRGRDSRVPMAECPFFQWLNEQRDREDTLALRGEILDRPEWIPVATVEALIDTAYTEGVDRSAIQRLCAEKIATYPWSEMRVAVERMLVEHGEKIEPEAWPPLLEWFAAHHPAAKRFFAQPHVLAKVPATIDLTGLPSPTLPALAGVELHGQREIG